MNRRCHGIATLGHSALAGLHAHGPKAPNPPGPKAPAAGDWPWGGWAWGRRSTARAPIARPATKWKAPPRTSSGKAGHPPARGHSSPIVCGDRGLPHDLADEEPPRSNSSLRLRPPKTGKVIVEPRSRTRASFLPKEPQELGTPSATPALRWASAVLLRLSSTRGRPARSPPPNLDGQRSSGRSRPGQFPLGARATGPRRRSLYKSLRQS